MKIVVIGGGWSGCAAALRRPQTRRAGRFDRTHRHAAGNRLVGGIMRNNGRFTGRRGDDLHGRRRAIRTHRPECLASRDRIPGHRHSNLYSVARMEPMVRNFLLSKGVSIHCQMRVTDVEMSAGAMRAVFARREDESLRFDGDVFVDATGTAGGPANCNKYGNGCAMCILRCHSFGGRVSVTARRREGDDRPQGATRSAP